MAETTPTPAVAPAAETEVKKPNFIVRFVHNHPRISKVTGFLAAILGVVGLVAVAKNSTEKVASDLDQLESRVEALEPSPTDVILTTEA